MTPNPKRKRIKLSAADYRKLRETVYWKQRRICKGCKKSFPFNEWSLHHKDTGGMGMRGDDIESNVDGYCLKCHPP